MVESTEVNKFEMLEFYYENFSSYYEEYLEVRRKIKELLHDPKADPEIFRQKVSPYLEQNKRVNKYVNTYFILLIIEVAKILENNQKLGDQLDNKFSIKKYSRVRDNIKLEEVASLRKQIKHYRDACVHNIEGGISQYPEYFSCGEPGGHVHLEPVVEGDSLDHKVFMIGQGEMTHETLKAIIEEILNNQS